MPKCFPVDLLPDGRATFVQCITFGDLFSREDEVMEASLNGERKPFSSGSAELGKSGSGGEVNDVGAKGGMLFGTTGDEVYGGGFEGFGTGGEEGGVIRGRGRGVRMRGCATVKFGVKEEEGIGFL